MNKKKNSKKEWWETIFDEKYTATYIDATPSELTKKQVDFLEKNLKLKKGMRILDLACGSGRHSLELAKRGYNVIGVDFSKHLLKLAKKEAKKQDVNVGFIEGDIRKINFENEFNAVINMFTSFGYFENEKDHSLIIKKVFQALRVKGNFLIDLKNPLSIISAIFKNGWVDAKTGVLTNENKVILSDGLELTTINQFDSRTLRWIMIRKWKEGGRKKSYQTNIRLFFLPEIKNLIESNGLKIKKVFGDFNGGQFNTNSNRLIILAEKD